MAPASPPTKRNSNARREIPSVSANSLASSSNGCAMASSWLFESRSPILRGGPEIGETFHGVAACVATIAIRTIDTRIIARIARKGNEQTLSQTGTVS
jgi:hypothetical protein